MLDYLPSDNILFWVLEASLVLVAVIAAIVDMRLRLTSRKAEVSAHITRGDRSMRIFYGVYTATTVILVALALQVELAKDHRVFFVFLNVGLVAYICFLNSWFRNKLIGWIVKISEIEGR